MNNLIITDRGFVKNLTITSASIPKPISTIISINDPKTKPPDSIEDTFTSERSLILNFHDTESRGSFAPAEDHIHKIKNRGFDLLKKAIAEDRMLLIHCNAGMCRSTAAGAIVLCELWGPGSEEKVMEHILNIRHIADPNWLMLDIYDSMTGRELVKAKEKFEPLIMERFRKRCLS